MESTVTIQLPQDPSDDVERRNKVEIPLRAAVEGAHITQQFLIMMNSETLCNMSMTELSLLVNFDMIIRMLQHCQDHQITIHKVQMDPDRICGFLRRHAALEANFADDSLLQCDSVFQGLSIFNWLVKRRRQRRPRIRIRDLTIWHRQHAQAHAEETLGLSDADSINALALGFQVDVVLLDSYGMIIRLAAGYGQYTRYFQCRPAGMLAVINVQNFVLANSEIPEITDRLGNAAQQN